VSKDKEALRAYQMRQMALSDWTSAVNNARREGKKEGMEAGMKKGKREGIEEGKKKGMEAGVKEVARKALAKGFTVEDVSRITGLDGEVIKGL
jgi:predicted transposase YdaD